MVEAGRISISAGTSIAQQSTTASRRSAASRPSQFQQPRLLLLTENVPDFRRLEADALANSEPCPPSSSRYLASLGTLPGVCPDAGGINLLGSLSSPANYRRDPASFEGEWVRTQDPASTGLSAPAYL
jgi:hypothetical protein